MGDRFPRKWRGGTGLFLGVLLSATLWLFCLHPFSPSMASADLDGSWVTVLGEMADAHARWGVDLVFTYGPASPLVTGYANGQYLTHTLPILLGFCCVLATCVVRLLGAGLSRLERVAGSVLCALVLVVAAHATRDAAFLALTLSVFLLALDRARVDRVSRATVLAGAFTMGVVALSKTTFLLGGTTLALVADFKRLREFRVPPLCMGMLGGFLVAYAAYGQMFSDLPSFLRLQGEAAFGYASAMATPGSPREVWCFVLAAVLAVAVLIVAEFRPRAPLGRAVAAPLGLAALLLLAFKAGFIRQDPGHTPIAWGTLAVSVVLVGFARIIPRLPHGRARSALAGALVLSIPILLWDGADFMPALVDVGSRASKEIGNTAWFLKDPIGFAGALEDDKAEVRASLRAGAPLPALAGFVDTIPSNQSAVIANGLDYRPRPNFQEYSTYTAGLIAANKAFYAGSRAPDWVLFAPGSIDNRYPASAEGALWPDLWRRYEPVRRAGDLVVLRRRPAPLPEGLGTPRRRSVRLGEAVPLGMSGPVFARIAVVPSLAGRVAALLFRAPALTMTVRLRDGRTLPFRLIPAQAREGFLLSPLVDSADGFAALAFGRDDGLEGRDVLAVTVDAVAGGRWAFGSAVEVDLASVTPPAAAPAEDAKDFDAALGRERAWHRLVEGAGLEQDLRGEHLRAQPPKSLTVPVVGPGAVVVGFGVEDMAWRTGSPQGVCFSVKAGDARPGVLWQRCLDPGSVERDRGEQSARIELPTDTRALTLETSCRRSCDWGWSYWSGVAPDPADRP